MEIKILRFFTGIVPDTHGIGGKNKSAAGSNEWYVKEVGWIGVNYAAGYDKLVPL